MSMIILNQITYLYLWTTSNSHMVEAYIWITLNVNTTLNVKQHLVLIHQILLCLSCDID